MADIYMKTLTIEEGGDTLYPLPIVTTEDDGKVLTVVDGEWTLGEVEASTGVELPTLTNPGQASDMLSGKQLIDGAGNIVTGTMTNNGSMTKTMDGINTKSVSVPAGYTSGGTVSLTDDIDNEVETQADLIAQISSVLDGKVGGGNPVLQSKTVTPTTSKQTVKPDSGYDGLSDVTVNAMTTATQATPSITVSSSGLITAKSTQSAGYVASGTKQATKQLTTQGAKTVTPTTSNQTAVASGRYTTGAVTVKGDSNLVSGNIKSGVSIFGVTGNYEGSGGGSSGGGIETCTVYFYGITAYEATVFENGAVTYKTGTADTLENVVRNSILYVKDDITDLIVSGGVKLQAWSNYAFVRTNDSIVDIYYDGPTEEEIPEPF